MSRALLFVAAITFAAPAFAETAYFAEIEDLPIPPGMTETANPVAALFESQGGDLIIAAAHGSASPESVERFYSESLAALGWSFQVSQRDEGLAFIRGRERLVLSAEPQHGGTYLRVRLIVRRAATDAD